jgi:hypothetical protein
LTTPHCIKERRYGAETEDRTSEERDTIAYGRENGEDKVPQQRDNDGGQNQATTASYRTHTIGDVMLNILTRIRLPGAF